RSINAYLEGAGCKNRSQLDDIFILKFSELSSSTVMRMEACQKDFYQINFVTQAGQGAYWLNAHQKPQAKHTLYFISPEHVYSWVRDERLQGYLLYFYKGLLHTDTRSDESEFANLFDICRDNRLKLLPENIPTSLALFELLHSTYYQSNTHRLPLLRTTLRTLLTYLISIDLSPSADTQTEKTALQFQTYRNLVNNLFLKEKSVAAYAERLHISPNHLNAICKQQGKTAKAVIQERILKEAKFLVAFTEKDIAEISFYLGFAEPTHFSRFFKQETGQSPRDYRIQNR
ncbi:MAG: helix-turn-helix domain-containing protein, partial [Bacteroidota bacterium]